MERITSFCVDHNHLTPGIYLSREDTAPSGDIIRTYDIRMKSPNREAVLSIASAHTIEHIGATYLRNDPLWSKKTIYFGPMGCRTGMYVVFSGQPQEEEVVEIFKKMYQWIAELADTYPIPWATKAECGNYRDHSLVEAREDARTFSAIMKDINNLGEYMYL